MQVRKRYQNGGRPGDPLKVDSLAARQGLAMQEQELAQLRQMLDAEFQKQLEEKTRLRGQYGVYADDPAGLPSTDPFLALTAAGDAEAIGSGLAEMSGGDLLTGAGNVLLGAASVAIPGTLPKIKNIRGVEVGKRTDEPEVLTEMIMRDDQGIDLELGEIAQSGYTSEGQIMFEPFISGHAARIAGQKERLDELLKKDVFTDSEVMEIRKLRDEFDALPPKLKKASASEVKKTMALATNEMLDAVPIGGKVGSASLSTDSYPIILNKWARGQLSAKRYDTGSAEGYGYLNPMGRKYKNSPEVEQWHRNRYEGDPEIVGYDDLSGNFNSMYAPAQQMEFEEFVQVDPAAKKAFQAGEKKQAEKLYEKYTIQADNDLGVSSFALEMENYARLSRGEAEELANKFNMRMRDLAQERSTKQERMLKRGDNQSKAKLSDDLGIPPAKVIEDTYYPGYFTIQYPQIPFHRNFEYGGKFKIKKKRRPGMQVKR